MSFRKSSVGWKERFKETSQRDIKVKKKVISEDPKLRWTPGKAGDPKRHTFSADHFQKRQRIGYVTRQNPSLIRRLKSDLGDLSLPQHVVVAKSKARQDMAVTRLTSVMLRHANKLLVKAMMYWKFGALESLEKRTKELEEALNSSNDLNDHLEGQLKELTLKMDNMVTTEHLTKRKSQKLLTVSMTKTRGLEQSLNKALNTIKKITSQKLYVTKRMKKMGTKAFFRSLWRCNARAAFRKWQEYHQHIGYKLDKTRMARNFYCRRRMRSCFDGLRLAKTQTNRVQILFLRKRRLAKRDVYLKWWEFIARKRNAGFLLGKLMLLANKRMCQPAFDSLKRQDVVHHGRALVEEIKNVTNERIQEMKTAVKSKVVYSMYRIIIQNHKASKGKAMRIWQNSVRFIIWEEKVHLMTALYVCKTRIKNVWCHWIDLIKRRKRARKYIQRAKENNENQITVVRLRRGFSSFYTNCHFINGRRYAARTLSVFIYRQAMNQCATALAKWIRHTHAMNVQISLMTRVDRYSKNSTRAQMIKSFRLWNHVSFKILKVRRLILARICEKQRKTQLCTALTAWQRNGARNVIGSKAVEAMDRCIRQTILRLRRKAFAKFVMITRRSRAIEHRLFCRSELKRLRALDTCWGVWCDEVMSGREQTRLAIKAAKKSTYDSGKKCLQEWRKVARESKITRVLLKRAAAKMLNRLLHYCMEVWLDYTEERQNARKLAGRVFRRLVDGQLSGAWNKWYQDTYVDGRRFDQLRMNSVWTAFKSKAKRWLKDSFQLWRDDVKEYVALLYLQEKAGNKIRKLKLLNFFHHWKSTYTERKHNRVVIMRATLRLRNKTIVKSLGSWLALLERRDSGRIILNKMCFIFLKLVKRNALRNWRKYLKIIEQMDARKSVITAHLSRSMQKWLNRDKARVMRTWKDKVLEVKTNRRLVQRAMMKWSQREMASSFESWVEYSSTKIRNRRLIAKIRAKWLKQNEAKCYRTWVSFIEHRRDIRNKMRRALLKFKESTSKRYFHAWAAVPVLRCRRVTLMVRIVRRWRKSHLYKKINVWKTFTVAERIIGRKKKPQGAPPPVVEEELSTKSKILKRSLERGFRITASEGIPEYNPLKDKHATYAHTEHYREEIRRLKSLEAFDRKKSRVEFPGARTLKQYKQDKDLRKLLKFNGGRSRSNSGSRVGNLKGGSRKRPASAGGNIGGRTRKGGLRGPQAALEARRTSSLKALGRKYNNWTDDVGEEVGESGRDGGESTRGRDSAMDKNAKDALEQQVYEAELKANEERERAQAMSRKVKELELQMTVNTQRFQSKTSQLQEVLSATDDKASELQEISDNLALELASRKRRTKSLLDDMERKLDRESGLRAEMQRKYDLVVLELERESKSHLKREKIVREEVRKEIMAIEKEKRKNLIQPSYVKKLEKKNMKEMKFLQKKLDQSLRIEKELENRIELEKLKSQDAVEDALTSAKETLEAQQALVRAAEDRSLKNHLVATKMKKAVRDMSVKLEEKVGVMEEEMETMAKQLARAKRLLRAEKKRAAKD